MLKRIPYGGDYNPEQWGEKEWQEDMELFRQAGINIATLNVFNWAMIQKNEETYDFSELDETVKRVTDHGMDICMATSTAAMPPWMARKYPDILRTEWNGIRRKYGSRHNACPNSPTYRRFAPMLAEKLAEHYRDQKNIIAWHVSNEYGGRCYCENCEKAFRVWLRKKYGTLEKLNHEWNTHFWGHTFYDWEEIVVPNEQSEEFGDSNHARTSFQGISIDYARFMSDSLLENFRAEYDAIKKHIPDAKITTNMMGLYKPLDYQKWGRYMDFVSYDNYPGNGESPAFIALRHDLMRGAGGGAPYWLMEQTPSVSNWLPNNSLKRPGVLALWSYQALAHGADSVMYFQLRRSAGACEKYHGAVIDHAGTGNTRVFREVAKLGGELAALGDELTGSRLTKKAAVIFDWDNWWATEYSAGPNNALRYVDEIFRYYQALQWLHIPTDVISCEDELSCYDVVIAPLLYMVKPGVAERIMAYTAQGGRFITTFFSGYVNENDYVTVGGYPGELRSLLGIWVEEIDSLPPEQCNYFTYEGKRYPARMLCDLMHLEGAAPLADYEEDFYAGMPVITEHKYGKGTAYYVGTCSEDAFYREFLKHTVFTAEELPQYGEPEEKAGLLEVTTREKDGRFYTFFLNHDKEALEVTVPVTGRTLPDGVVCEKGSRIRLAAYETVILQH